MLCFHFCGDLAGRQFKAPLKRDNDLDSHEETTKFVIGANEPRQPPRLLTKELIYD
ncbi:hypothetical protein M758_10G136300 [Ceratodon purpureus]|uniref:Uncharacterized protein n=1 Tax=Ceratodon purpureus TaxID=3225 RepID=A0A8T0GN67_CERPU|nr:hypothetical protein KC19_10G140800 [Ceratodon purpureus]KAG0603999.1 hypothetical protein M758_10G136300 [Ceratodon purpureus]